ncbi:MAG: hypothetical protein HPY83_00890 [Anaerolineae bacterium]|nr:hypothetical protein [Anaerolineae bacterium]
MSQTPGLLSLLVAPAIAGGLVYFLRMWRRLPHLAAAAAAAGTAYFVRAASVGLSDQVLGRPLVLDAPAKHVILISLAAVALSNLALLSRATTTVFPSTSLGLASLVGAAVTLDNLTLASLCLLIGGVASTLSWESRGRASGHLQYLVAVTIGSLLLALAASVMEVAPDEPSRTGSVALQLGMGLLLGLVPVGLWKGTLGRDSASLATSVVGLVLAPAAIVLFWRFTSRHHWLIGATLLPELLRVSTLVTVAFFSLRAAVTPSPRVFVAAASQSQFALVLLVLLPSLGSSALLPLTSEWLLARVVPVLLFAVSAALLTRSPRPATRVLFAFSAVSLMGLPGTPLFPAYLAGLLALPQRGLDAAILLFVAGTAIGSLRLAALRSAEETTPGSPDEATFIALGLALLSLALGLNPTLLRGYLT